MIEQTCEEGHTTPQYNLTPHNCHSELDQGILIERTCEEEHTFPRYNRPLALCHSELDSESHTKLGVTATDG